MTVAVVTGAGRGIGKAISQRLARDGYELVALDSDGDSAAAVADEIGGVGYRCDVSDEASIAEVSSRVASCGVLVNNAGIWNRSSLLDMSLTAERHVLDVNILGIAAMCQAFVPKMIDNGAGVVVNVSSVASWTHSTNLGLYTASKGAVQALTGQMAIEWGPHGVRVNAVGPGLIMHDANSGYYEGDKDPSVRARNVPIGRVGSPDDIADVVAFLCSGDARYVTGQEIYVDGGISAGRPSL